VSGQQLSERPPELRRRVNVALAGDERRHALAVPELALASGLDDGRILDGVGEVADFGHRGRRVRLRARNVERRDRVEQFRLVVASFECRPVFGSDRRAGGFELRCVTRNQQCGVIFDRKDCGVTVSLQVALERREEFVGAPARRRIHEESSLYRESIPRVRSDAPPAVTGTFSPSDRTTLRPHCPSVSRMRARPASWSGVTGPATPIVHPAPRGLGSTVDSGNFRASGRELVGRNRQTGPRLRGLRSSPGHSERRRPSRRVARATRGPIRAPKRRP
jgi:hypothetical protein